MLIHPSASATPVPSALPDDPALKKTCVQFEGQFFDMMLQEMRKTVPQDTLLGDDANQQDIFQGMMDDQVSQDMAEHGGSNDIANAMYRQLLVREHPALTENAASEAITPTQSAVVGAASGLRSLLNLKGYTLKTQARKTNNELDESK
jgi:Rod binding domain-containing protein